MKGDNAFDPDLFAGIVQNKGMTGIHKLIAILCICATTLIGGVAGIQATRPEPEKERVISVSYGETQNRGNYESRKINVFLSKTLKPHQDSDEELDKELYDLKRFVQDRLVKYAADDSK